MLILSGGTGTPKLLNGLRNVISHEDITVVVNTAEDVWVSGNLISPDIDTVLYLLSDRIDTEKWWGVAGDTFRTHEIMKSLGYGEGMMIGDLDRGTHIIRSNYIRAGHTLTQSIEKLCEAFGIGSKVLPMSDDPVSTIITTPQGDMHFQDFWVMNKGEPEVVNVRLEGVSNASISSAVMDALEKEDEVLIGPSNPITSIGPILAIPGMRDILREKKVIAVSPIIGNEPVSGPAGKLMHSRGFAVSSLGVARCYQDIVDVFIVDERDNSNLSDFEDIGCSAIRCDTLMKSVDISVDLAKRVVDIFDKWDQ